MLAVPLTDYYEEVRRYLTCPEEVKDDLIYDVNRKVMDLNADRPDLDYDDVVDFLGEPENLAQSLMDNLDPVVILRGTLQLIKFVNKPFHVLIHRRACSFLHCISK